MAEVSTLSRRLMVWSDGRIFTWLNATHQTSEAGVLFVMKKKREVGIFTNYSAIYYDDVDEIYDPEEEHDDSE